MTRTLLLSLAVLIAGCSQSDGAQRKAPKTPEAPAAATAAAMATGLPQDPISQKADAGRITGSDTSSKLWVIMASDFQCPFCKQWHDASFAPVMDYAKKGKIRLAFINMPLSMHPNAMPAAEAAMCAAVQGKFWPMHDALFISQDEWAPLPNPTAKFEALAKTAGVNMAQWTDCVAKHSTAALITADRDRLRGAGVQSTPTFFVNGKMVTNAEGGSAGAAADVPAAIEAALKSGK